MIELSKKWCAKLRELETRDSWASHDESNKKEDEERSPIKKIVTRKKKQRFAVQWNVIFKDQVSMVRNQWHKIDTKFKRWIQDNEREITRRTLDRRVSEISTWPNVSRMLQKEEWYVLGNEEIEFLIWRAKLSIFRKAREINPRAFILIWNVSVWVGRKDLSRPRGAVTTLGVWISKEKESQRKERKRNRPFSHISICLWNSAVSWTWSRCQKLSSVESTTMDSWDVERFHVSHESPSFLHVRRMPCEEISSNPRTNPWGQENPRTVPMEGTPKNLRTFHHARLPTLVVTFSCTRILNAIEGIISVLYLLIIIVMRILWLIIPTIIDDHDE